MSSMNETLDERVEKLKRNNTESLERRVDRLLGKGKKKKKEEGFVLTPEEWNLLEEQAQWAAARKKNN